LGAVVKPHLAIEAGIAHFLEHQVLLLQRQVSKGGAGHRFGGLTPGDAVDGVVGRRAFNKSRLDLLGGISRCVVKHLLTVKAVAQALSHHGALRQIKVFKRRELGIAAVSGFGLTCATPVDAAVVDLA